MTATIGEAATGVGVAIAPQLGDIAEVEADIVMTAEIMTIEGL